MLVQMDVKKHKMKRKRLCRICLSVVNKKAMYLYSTFRNSSISNHIISITNVDIRVIDGLPDKICSQCLAELETALNFKEKCENNNILLESISTDEPIVNGQNKKYEVNDVIKLKIEPDLHNDAVLEDSTLCVKASDSPDDNCTSQKNYGSTDADDFSDNEVKYEEDEQPLSKLKEKPFKSKAIDQHLQCDDCKDFFKSKCKLRVHWKKVHLRTKLICQSCKRDFKSCSAYNRHQKIKTLSCTECKHFRIEGLGKQRKFYCRECNYMTKRVKDMITHRVTHTGERPYACNLCGKSLTQLSALICHKETTHKEYKVEITCKYCGKFLKGRNAVYKHLKSHRNNEVQCKLCNKVLKNKQTMQVHMIRHSGVRSKQCELCPKTFYTRADICNHKRMTHFHGEYRYACDICNYKTQRKDCLLKHRAKHSGGKICCLQCGIFFENKEKLIAHEWRHNNKNFLCECGEKFFSNDTLRRHINKKHVKKEVPKGKDITRNMSLGQKHVPQIKIKNVKEEDNIPQTTIIQTEKGL